MTESVQVMVWPAALHLPPDAVHIWYASLDQAASYRQHLFALLTPEEQNRAARYRFERHGQHYIVSQGQLRMLLGSYLRCPPERIRFTHSPLGKPAVTKRLDGDRLMFNISHSQGQVIYAMTRNRAVGVDIEYIRPVVDAAQIAERFFSAQEQVALRTVPEDQKAIAFFNCWTRKEAYLKATGDGLSRPLHEFDVSLAPGEPALLLHDSRGKAEAARWSLAALPLVPGYAAALCVEGHGWRLICHELCISSPV